MKMTEVIELRNMFYVGEKEYNVNGVTAKYRTMVLVDLTAEQWNEFAVRQNTKMYVEMNGFYPETYADVKKWVKGLVAK